MNERKRILIVEDQADLRKLVTLTLGATRYELLEAADAAQALEAVRGAPPDLVLLDVMLPGVDGFGVLAAMRQQGRKTPVLMLTARDKVEDRVRGLEGGADDYLVKPFAFSELMARVGALLRRGTGSATPQQATELRLADLELDLIARRASRAQLCRGGRPLGRVYPGHRNRLR